MSFSSHNLQISKITLHYTLQNTITYPRFCIQVLDRPTYRLSPHGRKRAQDCTDTWMPLRSSSSRIRRISFRPGKYRIDADNAACWSPARAASCPRNPRCADNRNSRWGTCYRSRRMRAHCRKSSTPPHCCHISNICHRICDGDKNRSRPGIWTIPGRLRLWKKKR